jgi:hypothetical protein
MVAISIVAAVALATIVQLWAFRANVRFDLTRDRINSINTGTAQLLHNVEAPIELISLYVEADPEPDAYPKYRRAVHDLLQLYAREQPAMIRWRWINPLREQTETRQLLLELREHPRFKAETEAYHAAVSSFREEHHPQFKADLETILTTMSTTAVDTAAEAANLTQTLHDWIARSDELQRVLKQQESTGTVQLRLQADAMMNYFSDAAQRLDNFGRAYIDKQLQAPATPPVLRSTLESLQEPVARWTQVFSEVAAHLATLPPPALDRIEAVIQNGNAVLVRSDNGAEVIPFEQMWPTHREQEFAEVHDFSSHRFAGEGALTPALIRLLSKTRSAIIFVRYAGESFFSPGEVIPNRISRPGPLTILQAELERLNFLVAEWDLAESIRPPAFEPTPSQTIYVIRRPGPRSRGATVQAGDAITAQARAELFQAIQESGRALFLTGFDLYSEGYEFRAYLEKYWGISVDGRTMAITAVPMGPGEWTLDPKFMFASELEFIPHAVTVDLERIRPLLIPKVTTLGAASTLPDGVTVEELARLPKQDRVWAVGDIKGFLEDFQSRVNDRGQNYLVHDANDIQTPIPFMMSSTRGDDRVVVFGASDEMLDGALISAQTVSRPDGNYEISRRYPGNFAMFMNTIHYLNDSLQWRDATSALDSSRLAVDEQTRQWWQFGLMILWPMVGIGGGLFAAYVRRR